MQTDVWGGKERFYGSTKALPYEWRRLAPAARKDAICTERCMKSAERFLCVILSEGGEAAEVEPVGRLGRGGILGGGKGCFKWVQRSCLPSMRSRCYRIALRMFVDVSLSRTVAKSWLSCKNLHEFC